MKGYVLILCVSAAMGLCAAAQTDSIKLPTSRETASSGNTSTTQASSTIEWKNRTARVGNVEVDANRREVRVPGWVNMTEGAIELLACGRGGKTHESIFVLDVHPLDLQTALLLLGLEPGTPPTGLGEGRPSGTEVDLWIQWQQDGERKEMRAEKFVYNYETKSVLPDTPWIFTGSVIEDGQFKALAEESLVVTYWDPWAIINIPLPCGSNDEILAVNRTNIPPLNTPIVMRIVPRERKETPDGRASQRVH